MFGGRQGCQGAPSEASLFTPEDWNTWRMVTKRPPRAGEEPEPEVLPGYPYGPR